MKKKNKLSVFILMLCFCLSLCFTSFADESTPPPTNTETEVQDVDSQLGFIEMMLGVVFGNSVWEDESGSGTGSVFDPWEMLKNSTELALSTMEDITQGKMYTAFEAIGMILMTIYFLLEFSGNYSFNLSSNNKPSMEEIIKYCIKFIICVIFFLNIKYILYFMLCLSEMAFHQAVNTLSIENVTMSIDVVDKVLLASGYVKEASVLDFITHNLPAMMSIIFSFAIPWLIGIVCNFLLVYVILSRIVNIVVQGAIAPIAMADIFGAGNNIRDTRAWGYVRNFAGLCFQSVVIVVILYAVNSLIGTYVAQLVDGLNNAVSFWQLVNLGIQITVLKVVQVGSAMGSAHMAKGLFSGNGG